MYKNDDFVQLAIRRTGGDRWVWLKCLRETAELYGWDKAFPELLDARTAASPTGFVTDPGRRGWKNSGGVQHRISRSTKTQGWPAGKTNSFRVSGNANSVDLRLIAEATTVEWTWMTCKHGGRRTKGWWLEDRST